MSAHTDASHPRRLSVATKTSDTRFQITSLLWMASITLLLVPVCTLIDIKVSRWFARDPFPGEISDTLDMSLIYAHTSGIILVLLGIGLLAPKSRWHIPRLATLAWGAGVVATLAKIFVLRPRPNSINLELATYDYAWIWSFDWTLSQFFLFDASTRAFPSAYLATATALTVGLWVVVPRARWMFVTLCVCTMLQRMYCGSHFLSDLLGSASVGLGWAFACYHPRLLGGVFDKMADERERPYRRADGAKTIAIEVASEQAEVLPERKAA